jgi:hypothetical protein
MEKILKSLLFLAMTEKMTLRITCTGSMVIGSLLRQERANAHS